MIRQRVWISGALLVTTIAGILIYELAIQPQAEKRREKSALAYPAFNPEQAKRVELLREGVKNVLVKMDKVWLVESEGNFPADTEGVEKLLDSTKSLTCDQEISNSEKELDRFDLTKEKALEVKISGEKDSILADFYVGKRGASYDSSYYRKADGNQVCLTYKNLASVFDRTEDTWRDKSIMQFNASDCKAIDVQDGSTEYRLEKDIQLNKWEVVIDKIRKPAQEWVVDGICQTLSKLKTSAFPSASFEQTGLLQPKRKITVTLVGDKTYTLLVGDKLKDKSDYYVQLEGKNVLYQLGEWQLNSLFKSQNELIQKESAPETKSEGTSSPTPPEKK